MIKAIDYPKKEVKISEKAKENKFFITEDEVYRGGPAH